MNILFILPIVFALFLGFTLYAYYRVGSKEANLYIANNSHRLVAKFVSRGGVVNGLRYRGLPFRVLIFPEALVIANKLVFKENILNAEIIDAANKANFKLTASTGKLYVGEWAKNTREDTRVGEFSIYATIQEPEKLKQYIDQVRENPSGKH